MITCNAFLNVPNSFKNKIKWWLFFLSMLIFGPFIIILIVTLEICRVTIDKCESCFLRPSYECNNCINCILALLVNFLIVLAHFALGLFLAGIFTALTYPIFIVGTVIKFAKIMRYWSSGNRFNGEGKVKAELLMRRSSSQSYGRRPTYHIQN
jgi:hypothetical protein